jgi:hypothetical protein
MKNQNRAGKTYPESKPGRVCRSVQDCGATQSSQAGVTFPATFTRECCETVAGLIYVNLFLPGQSTGPGCFIKGSSTFIKPVEHLMNRGRAW